jgi:hypothetical protein
LDKVKALTAQKVQAVGIQSSVLFPWIFKKMGCADTALVAKVRLLAKIKAGARDAYADVFGQS